jgi:hypothetical protein
VSLSHRVEDQMQLDKGKTTLTVNPSLTLAGILLETFAYHLGNRSALEWVINRADSHEYIVCCCHSCLDTDFWTATRYAGIAEENRHS